MPNKNYVKGRKKECKLVNMYKQAGKIAFRSAGSHGPVDVVVVDAENKKIALIQSKPDSMSENAKKKIEEENKELNGVYKVRFFVE